MRRKRERGTMEEMEKEGDDGGSNRKNVNVKEREGEGERGGGKDDGEMKQKGAAGRKRSVLKVISFKQL